MCQGKSCHCQLQHPDQLGQALNPPNKQLRPLLKLELFFPFCILHSPSSHHTLIYTFTLTPFFLSFVPFLLERTSS